MGKICLGWHLDEVIQFRGLSHWKVIKSTEQSRGWLGEKTMGILSFSSVKNDLLIYWGMMGCWPPEQARPDTINMAAPHSHCFSPSAVTAIYNLSGSFFKKVVGKYLGLLGYFHFLPSYHSFPFWTFSYRSWETGALKYCKQSLACLTHQSARLSLGFPSLVLCAGRSPHLGNSFGPWSCSPMVMQTLPLAPQSPLSVPLSALDTISISVQGQLHGLGPIMNLTPTGPSLWCGPQVERMETRHKGWETQM